MSIVFRDVPVDVGSTVRTGVALMASKRAFHTPRLSSTIKEKAVSPFTEQAFPVYNLGLSDIAENPDIKAAIQTGWRFNIKHNDELLAHAETIIDPDGKNLFAGTNEGPLVGGADKAIKVAEGQREIINGNYEVRLLFIPALKVTVLWLADKEDKVDYAVPIEPTPAYLTPNKIISLNDLLMILQGKAKSAFEAYRGKKGLVG